MQQKILTVVVPSYNAEKFLDKGIPTFLNDKILKDIEILIVNDGSNDSTGNIAEKYTKKFPDTVKAIHKQNGGHGSTINTGIDIAKGKYFCVVDADDWVDTENFVLLVEKLKSENSDLILTHSIMVNSEGDRFECEKIEGIPYNHKVELVEYIHNVPFIGMHNYVIKSEILKKNSIRCHEHHFYVDEEYVLYSLMHVQSVTVYDMIVYQYLVGRNGQSISIKSKQKNKKQYRDVTEYLIDFYKLNKLSMHPNMKKHYENKLAWFVKVVYATLLSYEPNVESKTEMQQFDIWLLSEAPEVYKANKSLCIRLLRASNFKTYKVSAFIYRFVNRKRE